MKTRLLIGLLVTCIAAVGVAAMATRAGTTAAPRAEAGVVALARPMALGRIEPASELIRVAGPSGQDAGRLVTVLVREGEWVAKDAVLAELDTRRRLLASVEQARSNLTQRRATLARTAADLDNQEKTLASAMEQQAAQTDRARWDLDRTEQLQRSGLYRDAALIDKRLALAASERALESTRLALDRNRARDTDGIRLDEAGARADVAAAEAAVLKAEADLEFSVIRSPIEGRVVRRLGRAGEAPGQDGVFEIADTRVMYVRAEIFESDLRHVRIGAAVVIRSRALDAPLHGRVERIVGKVSRQSIVGEDPAAALDARVVETLVRLDQSSSELTKGMIGLQVVAMFEAERP